MQSLILPSLIALFLGCLGIYLGSPNQRWRCAPWPPLAARAAGSVGLALGAWGCLRAFSIVAAVFVFCTALMLFFSLIPYLGALAASRRSDRHDAR